MTNLPLESVTARSLGAPKPGGWGYPEELLAGLVEILGDHRNNFIRANTKKGQAGNLPKIKVPRPTAPGDENRKRPATGEELARFLGKRVSVDYTPKRPTAEEVN